MIKEQGHQPHKSNVIYRVFTELGVGEMLFIASIDERGKAGPPARVTRAKCSNLDRFPTSSALNRACAGLH